MSGNRARLVTLVLILAVALGAAFAPGRAAYAQEGEERLITLDLRDATLDDALKLIFKSTPYSYVLASDVTGRVTLTLNNVTFAQALRAILDLQNLTYRREGNVYYITPKQPETAQQQPEIVREVPASQMKLYMLGPGGRYEFQFLDCRTVSSWFGGWEAYMWIIPWPAENQGGTGGGMGGGRGGGRTGGGAGGGGGGRAAGGGGGGGGGGGRGGGGGGGGSRGGGGGSRGGGGGGGGGTGGGGGGGGGGRGGR
ncbi:MAG: secretin and TonB N-terminal domain-containing protein [Armatimonadota bacterium]